MHTCIDCHINLFLEASHISIDDPSLIYIYKTYIYIHKSSETNDCIYRLKPNIEGSWWFVG